MSTVMECGRRHVKSGSLRRGSEHRAPHRSCPERGASKLTLLVFGSIAAVVGYVVYSVLPFIYCYYEMQNQMDQIVRIASTLDDAEVRKRLWYHVKKCEIPVEPEDLHVERTTDGIKVWMPYRETFSVPWRGKEHEIYTFDFYPNAESMLMEQ